MIVKIDNSFEKDTDKIKDRNLLNSIADCIDLLLVAKNIKSIKNLKKLKGANSFYRTRLGDYRISLEIKNETIELIRFLHRKDIYKYFPR
jgi:mRNA interferase RelE/StbE